MPGGGTDVIDSLQIQMSADVSKASRSIGNLTKKLVALEQASSNLSATSAMMKTFTQLSVAMEKLADAAKMFNSELGRVSSTMSSSKIQSFQRNVTKLNSNMPALTRSMRNAGGGVTNFTGSMTGAIIKARAFIAVLKRLWGSISTGVNLASDLVEVQNVVDKAFGSQAGKVDELVQDSIQRFGMAELTAKQISSRYQAMGVAMGISSKSIADASTRVGSLHESYDSTADSMADMSLNLTKLAADMASFYNVEVEEAGEALNAVFTGQTRPLTLAA